MYVRKKQYIMNKRHIFLENIMIRIFPTSTWLNLHLQPMVHILANTISNFWKNKTKKINFKVLNITGLAFFYATNRRRHWVILLYINWEPVSKLLYDTLTLPYTPSLIITRALITTSLVPHMVLFSVQILRDKK